MNAGESRLDLTNPQQCGVYFVGREDLDAIEREASQHGLWCARIDLGECRDKSALLEAIASAMHFPATFGHNWDALSDCIRDLEWLPARGHVLLFEHGDLFGNICPDDFDTLLDILDETSQAASAVNDLFYAFIAFPDSAFDTAESEVDD